MNDHRYFNNMNKQAGVELCQAQGKFKLLNWKFLVFYAWSGFVGFVGLVFRFGLVDLFWFGLFEVVFIFHVNFLF